ISGGYLVLCINRLLIDVGASVKTEHAAAASEVVWNETRRYEAIRNEPKIPARIRVGGDRRGNRKAAFGETNRVKRRVGNSKAEIFNQPGLHQLSPDFQILNTLRIGNIGARSQISQMPVLIDGSGTIVERISAGVVIAAVLANPRTNAQKSSRTERMLVSQGEAQSLCLLPLVLLQLIVGVWNLEPVARTEQIEVKRIDAGGLVIDSIENGRGVANIVKRSELR